MFTKIRKQVLTFLTLLLTASAVFASSHREAPFITENPKVDATDFYMFRSYETGRDGFVTLIANYLPLQDPYGGPNYFTLDPEALYEIHVDNNGNAQEDITFQFRFTNTLKDFALNVGPAGNTKSVSVPLINIGGISAGSTDNLNVTENYTVDIVRGDRRTGTKQAITNAQTGATTFIKPVDNIGNKSIADYAAYAATHIYNIAIPGCTTDGKMFVGQRKDPFVVNLGETFDLINYNPTIARNSQSDDLNDANATSLILEVPIVCLTSSAEPVIGAWTTASLRQGRLLNPTASFTTPSKGGGAWTQVSRLGMPLVNEDVIGIKDKNKFNASKPKDDAQFADYVTNPTLPELIEIVFGAATAPAPNVFPRADLVAVFFTGVSSVNQPANVVASEMLRLNTAISPTAAASQNSLGAALCFVDGSLTLGNPGCDPAGFPNGRRPGDDVVDIALTAAMGFLLPGPEGTDNAVITDGALVDASMFDTTFPYIKTPIPGSPN